MIWHDILIDRLVLDHQIERALATMFRVDPDDVRVFGDYSELLDDAIRDPRVLCERVPAQGEFLLKLGLMPRHPEQEQMAREHDDVDLLIELCALLQVRGLVATESVNPYEMLLLEPGQQPSPVRLDASALDDHEAYVLVPQRISAAD